MIHTFGLTLSIVCIDDLLVVIIVNMLPHLGSDRHTPKVSPHLLEKLMETVGAPGMRKKTEAIVIQSQCFISPTLDLHLQKLHMESFTSFGFTSFFQPGLQANGVGSKELTVRAQQISICTNLSCTQNAPGHLSTGAGKISGTAGPSVYFVITSLVTLEVELSFGAHLPRPKKQHDVS